MGGERPKSAPIDECLLPTLDQLTHNADYEAYSVRDRSWQGMKDWDLLRSR